MSPQRSNKTLRRRKATIEERARVLIVCEGEKTEPNYFKSLRRELDLKAVDVDVRGKDCGSAAKSVVEWAVNAINKRKGSDGYEAVWCVFDVETPTPDTTLSEALDRARACGISVALTNPCFEYWYILHFEKWARPFQRNADVVKKLLEVLPKYHKGDGGVYKQLRDYTDDAIRNAKLVIRERNYGADLSTCNPSTHVHLVVEYLRKISEKPKYPKSSR